MVRLVCYNIEYCEGMAGRWYEYLKFWKTFFPPKELDKKIVKALKRVKPDVLALVEVDTGSFRSKKDEAFYFGSMLGMHSIVEKVKYPLYGFLGLFHHVPILRSQSNAIVSKYDLHDIKYHVFHEGTKRMVIEATVDCPTPVTLLLAHLALGKKTRALQIKELIGIVNKVKNPVILMGDFNTFNGTREIRSLLKKTHLTDYYARAKTQPTYCPCRRLDYVLVSEAIKVKEYKVLDFDFSDHMPLFLEFDARLPE